MSWLWTIAGFIGLGITLYVGAFYFMPWLLNHDFSHLTPSLLGPYL